MTKSSADWPAEDRRAAEAVFAHHAQLSDELTRRTKALLTRAETAPTEAEQARAYLLEFLRLELVPHAQAEEGALYPSAAAKTAGKLLVDAMLGEHKLIMGLIEELAWAPSAVRAAATARAIAAVFATHLAKENDLVIPLLAEATDVSLGQLLEGMHELLGAEAHAGHHGQADSGAGGCGCGGCGCGGDAEGSAEAEAPQLTIDPRIDVRDLPHGQRHAAVISALDAIAPGHALVLVAPHAPERLLAEIDARFGAQVTVEWLQSGPEVWQLRLLRVPTQV